MTQRPPRDAEATKRRLLDAAAAEFAQYGVAGARVDRIAAASQSNKAQIYHYFTSKELLFAAVFDDLVANVLRDVPMDVNDLPEYAGKLFDGYEEHPDLMRLATWQRLEHRNEDPLLESVLAGNASKITAIADAQDRGLISKRFSPEVLLGLIVHTAALWSSQTPEYLHLTRHLAAEQRRAVVVDAASAFSAP